MGTLLTYTLLASTVILFVKWRLALRDGRQAPSYPRYRSEDDPVYQILLRLERKIDLLERKGMPASAPEAGRAEGFGAAPAAMPAAPGPEKTEAAAHVAPKGLGPEAARPVPASSPDLAPAPAAAEAGAAEISAGAAEISAGPAEIATALAGHPADPEPPAWEREARAILARIWSWILVGEEFRPKGVPLEFAMAGTWLMRLGVVVLVSCVAWFLKWSMVHGILGPSGRVGLSLAAGVALTVYGYRLAGREYRVMGQGLMGGGIAALYFAAYASGPMYDLLPPLASFALMALITVTGCALAAGARSQATAILAMLGGYATPALLSTGSANFLGLYAYMFLLGSGILGLAIARNWRLLHYLAFAAHWILVLGSLRAYDPDRHFATVLAFLVLFFAQQQGVSIGYAFRRALPISLLEGIQQLLQTGLFAALGYRLISEAAGEPWPALLAVGMGAAFVGQTLAVLKRLPSDRLSVSVSLALAGFFTAWSVPLLLRGTGLTVAWSLMALAWLWTGLRIRSQLLVLGSQVLFVLAGLRMGTQDFPRAFLDGGAEAGFGEYLVGLGRRLVTFGTFIACLLAASRLYWKRAGARPGTDAAGLRVPPEADIPFTTPFRAIGAAAFLAGFLSLFIVTHFEAQRFLAFHPPLRAPGTILIWTAFAAYLVLVARRQSASGSALAMSAVRLAGAALVVVCLRVLLVDWRDMGLFGSAWQFQDAGLQFAYRLAAHGALIALLWAFGTGLAGPQAGARIARAYRSGAVALLFLVVTMETRTVSGAFLPVFQAGALSLAWALFAMGLVAIGLRHDIRASRIAGLSLFGIVAAKVFLSDLSRLDMIWRVLSFLGVGTVLLLGSFAYLRASRVPPVADTTPKEKEPA